MTAVRSVPDCVCDLQSTYCSTMVQHCEALGRAVQVVNLDPAAEFFSYPVMAGERRDAPHRDLGRPLEVPEPKPPRVSCSRHPRVNRSGRRHGR